MEYDTHNKKIILNKTPNELDKFVIDFINILEKHTKYVIVSGYVSILLGRSRASEDVDLLTPSMSKKKFINLFKDLISHDYKCLNTSDAHKAYEMLNEYAIRFFKDTPVPNIEFKKITNKIQKKALDNRLEVLFGDKTLFISPLELQIVYKLSLMADTNFEEINSDKDFEDAKHLYEIFKKELDEEKIIKYVRFFNAEKKMGASEKIKGFDFSKIKNNKIRNFQDRIMFIKFWAEYIKKNPDEKWGREQASLVDSQIISSREFYKNLKATKKGRKILSNLRHNLLKPI